MPLKTISIWPNDMAIVQARTRRVIFPAYKEGEKRCCVLLFMAAAAWSNSINGVIVIKMTTRLIWMILDRIKKYFGNYKCGLFCCYSAKKIT